MFLAYLALGILLLVAVLSVVRGYQLLSPEHHHTLHRALFYGAIVLIALVLLRFGIPWRLR